MKNYIHLYDTKEQFTRFVEKNHIGKNKEIKIQIFISPKNKQSVETLFRELKSVLPNAKISDGTGFTMAEDQQSVGKALLLLLVIDEKGDTNKPEPVLNMSKEIDQSLENATSIVDQSQQLQISLNNVKDTLTELKRHLEASVGRYRSLYEHNPNLIFTMDKKGRMVNVNKAFQEQLGYTLDDIRNHSAIDFVKVEDRGNAHTEFVKVIHGQMQTLNIQLCDSEGSFWPYKITHIPIFSGDKLVGVHGIGINQTAQKEAEDKITQLAYHDGLTGVANRLLFEKSLNVLSSHAEKNEEKLAVIFLDLDRFKVINDTAGHFVGDHILKMAVERIQSQLHPTQLLARFEGDKFSIIIPHLKSKRTVNTIIEKINDAFRQSFIYKGAEYFLSVTMGISVFPDDGTNDVTLMKNADIALYSAKQQADETFLYFSKEMSGPFYDRLEFESYLRKALTKNEFNLYYQPQVSVDTGKVAGCEALLRWNHPTLGIVSPSDFIPLAEEIGIIEDIGLWVLREACKQVNAWREKGITPFPVSINVSVRQFLKKDFVGHVREIINEEGVDPSFIHLEITESTTLRDIQYSIGLVKELKDIGIRVSLDDFGTGYSALSYLKDFSIDILKIDRSFIRNLDHDSQDGAIVKAIIMMCQGLSLQTVAEGVETIEQLNLLKNYGCEVVQGFYFSKPLPNEEFEHYVRQMANPA